MTRLTEATETFAWARDIDWSDGASAMRSGEEHFKRRKASYLKRKEEERKSGIKSIKKSPTSHGAGSRFCQKFAKLSFGGGKINKEKEEKIFFSTKAFRAQGIFDHSGFTGRRQMTPFGVRLSQKEGQANVNIEINEANLEIKPLLESGGFLQQLAVSTDENKPLIFYGTTQYLIALLPTIELALKDKQGRICTADFFLLENFFPRIQGIMDTTIEAMTVGTSIRAQAWERFHKPDKDAKIIHPNIYHNNGKPRPNCILITRDAHMIKTNRLSPLRPSVGNMASVDLELCISTNSKGSISSRTSGSISSNTNSSNSSNNNINNSTTNNNVKLRNLASLKTSPRISKNISSKLIENNEGLKGKGLSTVLQHSARTQTRIRKIKRRAANYKIPSHGRGASGNPLISPYIVRNLPSVDVKALQGLPPPLVKFGQEIDPIDGIAYDSIPTWSP